MKLPGFTADASLHIVRGAYRASTTGDALDQTGTHKAGSVEPAVDCQYLGMCCARTRDPRSDCCVSYSKYCS